MCIENDDSHLHTWVEYLSVSQGFSKIGNCEQISRIAAFGGGVDGDGNGNETAFR